MKILFVLVFLAFFAFPVFDRTNRPVLDREGRFDVLHSDRPVLDREHRFDLPDLVSL